MTITFDAASTGVSGGTPVPFGHTPVGTPSLVVGAGFVDGSDIDQITGISYGSLALAPAVSIGNASGNRVYLFWAGSAIPTGLQSVSHSQTTTNTKVIRCATFTAGGDCALDAANVASSALTGANPSLAVTGTAAGGMWIAALVDDLATAVTGRGAGQTALHEVDQGTWNTAWSYQATIVGADTLSYTIASDFYSFVAASFYETTPPPDPPTLRVVQSALRLA